MDQEKLKEAKTYLDNALKIKIAYFGTDNHIGVADSYNNLAVVLNKQGDLKGTIEYLEKSVKIKISCLGTETHSSVAIGYTNLADIHMALKQTQRAKEYYIRAKNIHQQTGGNKHDAFYDGKIRKCVTAQQRGQVTINTGNDERQRLINRTENEQGRSSQNGSDSCCTFI